MQACTPMRNTLQIANARTPNGLPAANRSSTNFSLAEATIFITPVNFATFAVALMRFFTESIKDSAACAGNQRTRGQESGERRHQSENDGTKPCQSSVNECQNTTARTGVHALHIMRHGAINATDESTAAVTCAPQTSTQSVMNVGHEKTRQNTPQLANTRQRGRISSVKRHVECNAAGESGPAGQEGSQTQVWQGTALTC